MEPRPFDYRLQVCHGCEHHDHRGRCTVDGRGIAEAAERDMCPMGKFADLATAGASESPGMLHGLVGVAKAVSHVGWTDAATIAQRRVICRGCAEFRDGIAMKSCRLCGCLLWAKTALAAEHCPLAKW